jgi:hypothetical protein
MDKIMLLGDPTSASARKTAWKCCILQDRDVLTGLVFTPFEDMFSKYRRRLRGIQEFKIN